MIGHDELLGMVATEAHEILPPLWPNGYKHPTTLADFESVYRTEYEYELASCDRWIKWCEKHGDTHGINFHQGLRSAHVFNNIKMGQLLRVLKGEAPNV